MAVLLWLLALGYAAGSMPPQDLPPPATNAAAVVVMDPASRVIYHEKNADVQRVPASIQKLLTAMLVIQRGDLDQQVEVSASDTQVEPSKLWLQAGQQYTRRQLLEAILVKSANDAALALARDHSGSITKFAEAMNAKAWKLGCRNSHFVNPHGLTAERQYSSARDLSLIAAAAYYDTLIRSIVAMRELEFRYHDGRTKTFKNTNKVMLAAEFCNGMKTGYTRAAGYCLVSSGSFGGRDLLCVLLGAGEDSVWNDSHDFLAWGLGIRVIKEAPAPATASVVDAAQRPDG